MSAQDLVEHLAAVHKKAPIPPKLVSADSAPCKQNVLLGDDATLDRFPIPQVHPDDGGRYPNTWGVFVARTPDGRWTNWSISRIMMLDNRHMTGLFLPQQHIGMIWAEWEKIGKPMPFAVVQGGDPGVPMVGGMPIPDEVDEGTFLGTLYGEPVESSSARPTISRCRQVPKSLSKAMFRSPATPPKVPTPNSTGMRFQRLPRSRYTRSRRSPTATTHLADQRHRSPAR